MKNVEVALNVHEEGSQNADIHLDKISLSMIDFTFDFDIEEVLREIAMLKLSGQETELEKREAAISENSTNNEVWGTLEKENEEIYYLLHKNHIEVIEEYFILGFVEAYKMMWKIVKNG